MTAPREELLTVHEIAGRLKVNPETVRRWLRTGSMKGAIRSNSMGWRAPESEVQRLLLAGRPGADKGGE
jgi:excisionase family DNA binding protein